MHYIQCKKILSSTNGLNIYRGCTHGCIYCDSRSLCYNIEHAFTDIAVKENAITALDSELKSKRKHVMVGTGSMSDPYMPLENELFMTRRMLEVVDRNHDGVVIQTKSDLFLRDLELLKRINKHSKVVISTTFTTYDEELCKIIEPNVCTTKKRFEAIRKASNEGLIVGVWFSPFLPFINDTKENLKGLLDYAIEAKVKYIICFGIGLTLREGNREYFYKNLDIHFPGLKDRYIRKYGNSYEVASNNSSELMDYFIATCRANGIMYNVDEIFTYLHTYKANDQMTLFGDE